MDMSQITRAMGPSPLDCGCGSVHPVFHFRDGAARRRLRSAKVTPRDPTMQQLGATDGNRLLQLSSETMLLVSLLLTVISTEYRGASPDGRPVRQAVQPGSGRHPVGAQHHRLIDTR